MSRKSPKSMKAINSKKRNRSSSLAKLNSKPSFHLQLNSRKSRHLRPSKEKNNNSKNQNLRKHLQEIPRKISRIKKINRSQTTTWWQLSYRRVINSLRISQRKKMRSKMIRDLLKSNKNSRKTLSSRTQLCLLSKLNNQPLKIQHSPRWKVRKPKTLIMMMMKNSSS